MAEVSCPQHKMASGATRSLSSIGSLEQSGRAPSDAPRRCRIGAEEPKMFWIGFVEADHLCQYFSKVNEHLASETRDHRREVKCYNAGNADVNATYRSGYSGCHRKTVSKEAQISSDYILATCDHADGQPYRLPISQSQ